MENIFDKFKKLNLDTSPIGLSIELREPFFCTPIGAQIIGWDNGIHYCFIKGFKEIVFCVNPETCCNYYVYPLAKDFTDFLRLLLSLKTTNAIQQVVWMDKDAFENFMNDPDVVPLSLITSIPSKWSLPVRCHMADLGFCTIINQPSL